MSKSGCRFIAICYFKLVSGYKNAAFCSCTLLLMLNLCITDVENSLFGMLF